MSLNVAPGLKLPDEFIVSKAGILATSGAGKSNAAVRIAEQMFEAHLPWVAVDPKGDWWGIRSNRAGDGPGLKVPVLGGIHGDVPLAKSSGPIVARMIAERRLTCVLDVSEFEDRQAMWWFLHEFADELLRRNREPLHVFAEEASDYLPQTRMEKGNLPKAVGSWRRLVAQGRNRGIGVTLISQRSAKIDKDVLDLIETLIAMRATSPRDLNAIRGWVETHEGSEDLVNSLPSLDDGEAWVWSPHALKLAKRVRFHQRETFDSGATPLLAAGAAANPAGIADVDLDALNAELATAIERADADDPVKLRARIRVLEQAAIQHKCPEPYVAEPIVERVEVQVPVAVEVLPPALLDVVRNFVEAFKKLPAEFLAEVERLAEQHPWPAVIDLPPIRLRSPRVGTPGGEPPSPPASSARPRVPAPFPLPPAPSPVSRGGIEYERPATLDGYSPRAGARRMLESLARFPDGLSKSQLGTMAKVRKTGGTFGTYASELRRAGLIEVEGQHHRITDVGLDAVGGQPLPSDPDALRAEWADRLGSKNGARRMYDLLVESYPRVWGLMELAEKAEVATSGGSWTTYLSRLRTNGLIEETPDGVRAAAVLFA